VSTGYLVVEYRGAHLCGPALWGYMLSTARTSVCLIGDRAAVTTRRSTESMATAQRLKLEAARVCVCAVSAPIAQSAVTVRALSE
jgi:hypothetical protein